MPNLTSTIPLSLYIHIPWCVRKCPYCDFNSHEAKSSLPEDLYTAALLQELDQHLPLIQDRAIVSIFFGGGTPSLFSARAIEQILNGVAKRLSLQPALEITLEANPGTIDYQRFQGFREAGINRLSLGIQSLQDTKLKTLGRIHDHADAVRAISIAREAGFMNLNLDMMYGLPSQTIDDALHDIETALRYEPSHFSWYQLTIEPNTFFYHQTPVLPADETIWEMQMAGQQLLKESGFIQYEISAYSRPDHECLHNRNYWEFGDYLGIGAGAHSKISDFNDGRIVRFSQVRHPRDYLDASKRQTQILKPVAGNDLIFEFMLNALRLIKGVPAALFTERTGIPLQQIEPLLAAARQKGLMTNESTQLAASELGIKFLNDLQGIFLP
jgi:oxygen-independent coproporphyrinogen-3 oxidase